MRSIDKIWILTSAFIWNAQLKQRRGAALQSDVHTSIAAV